ncbi:MAG: preprotein translocase subunit SecG [Pseudomonadota bacterium]|nr:preprotein translocase subunit SecG [Pseudomonadota bacterium]
MTTVVIVIHLMLAIAMIFVVMIQQSEGGGLGIGGGSGGGMGGFMTGRAAASLLTRATAVIAAAFMATSLLLAILADQERSSERSVIDKPVSVPANQLNIPALPTLPPIPTPNSQ